MTTSTSGYDLDAIYDLLPAYLRRRDGELGRQIRAGAAGDQTGVDADEYSPLRSLIALFADELTQLSDGAAQMYDDLFIETCQEWVVPYIGELVGARLPPESLIDELNPRALVADTIANRRRKGTIAGLERVADAAVASWIVKATEYWKLLVQSQNLNHLRPTNIATVDLRRTADLELIGSGFDPFARSVETHAASAGGRYAIGTVGLSLWRIGGIPRFRGQARSLGANRYTFDPFGRAVQLYVAADAPIGDERIAERHVPGPLSRSVLDRELTDRYGNDLAIFAGGDFLALSRLDDEADDGDPMFNIDVCRLDDDPDNPGAWLNAEPAERTRIDPELGRIVLGDGLDEDVEVTYHYGRSSDIGGGSYERGAAPDDPVVVDAEGLAAAVLAANDGAIVVSDSGTTSDLTTITVADNATLIITAANGEAPAIFTTGLQIVLGDGSELTLDGLWIDGDITVTRAGSITDDALVRLADLTVVAGHSIEVLDPGVTLDVQRCLLGPLRVAESTVIGLDESVVDAGALDAPAIGAAGDERAAGQLDAVETTIIGQVAVDEIGLVSNSLLVASGPTEDGDPGVFSERSQSGCVRHSYLPFDSVVPRRYQCVPDSEADATAPIFTSLRQIEGGYVQLDLRTPDSIRSGSDQDSEMGVLHRNHQRAREIVLRDQLDEFLRFGMEAALTYES